MDEAVCYQERLYHETELRRKIKDKERIKYPKRNEEDNIQIPDMQR